MKQTWKANPIHNKILKQLLGKFERNKKYKILDAGSGRTSLLFLSKQFPESNITAIIYPGDERKRSGINESVKTKNYLLQEADLHKFKQKNKFDIVLAHLLLGEATKFSKKPFVKMLESLFNIKTDYLIVIDILDDPVVNYNILLQHFAKKGQIKKMIFEDQYIGFLLRANK